jgi:hypothetical protein
MSPYQTIILDFKPVPKPVTQADFTYRDESGVWDGIRWDGQTASFFAMREADEKKARVKLLQARAQQGA